ncbi:hypothetical protein ACWC6I_41055 [Streptomyces sp. NPDC001414]
MAEHGWPGVALVGEQGADEAWLLAQHADLDPAFQRQALGLLTVVVAAGDALTRHQAHLSDRVPPFATQSPSRSAAARPASSASSRRASFSGSHPHCRVCPARLGSSMRAVRSGSTWSSGAPLWAWW